MVQILIALNGSNDINVGYPNADRVPSDAPWTFRILNLFNGQLSRLTFLNNYAAIIAEQFGQYELR